MLQHPFYTTARLPLSGSLVVRVPTSPSGMRGSNGSPLRVAPSPGCSDIHGRNPRRPAASITVKPLQGAPELISWADLVREPASPPQSAPSSRQGSRIGNTERQSEEEEEADADAEAEAKQATPSNSPKSEPRSHAQPAAATSDEQRAGSESNSSGSGSGSATAGGAREGRVMRAVISSLKKVPLLRAVLA